VLNWCRRKNVARKIAAKFTFLVMKGVEDPGSRKSTESAWDPVWMQIAGLEGLFNLARCSKGYRKLLKRLPNISKIFEGFESVLSKENLNLLGEDGLGNFCDAKRFLSGLVLVLASSTDSMVWAIEMGLLRIIAAIFESTQRCEITSSWSKWIASPALTCNTALISLLESEASLEKAKGEERSVHFTSSRKPDQLPAPRSTNLALHQGEATRSECGPVHGSRF
jgi:hypothetical protein